MQKTDNVICSLIEGDEKGEIETGLVFLHFTEEKNASAAVCGDEES